MKKINIYKLFFDLILLLFSFALTFFIKSGNLNFDKRYTSFLPILILCWLLSGIFTSKFRDHEEGRLEPYAFSALYFTGLISLLIYGLQIFNLSRFVIFGGISIYLLLEVFFISGLVLPVFVNRDREKRRFSSILIMGELFVLTCAFFLLHYIKLNTILVSSEEYLYILLSIYLLWFFTSLFTHKFNIEFTKNFFTLILPFIRSYFIILSVFSAVVFGFRIEGFSRMLFFGTILIYSVIELFFIFSLFMYRYIQKSDIPEMNVFEAPLLHEDLLVKGVVEREKKNGKYLIPGEREESLLFPRKLSTVYLKNCTGIFDFIEDSVNLKKVDIVKSEVMDTGNPYNIEILPDNSLEFLMNMHEFNSFRYLNKYLISANNVLETGGIFVGKFEPAERRYFYFLNKYPAFFARIFYTFDFIWKRIFPKIPVLKFFYFLLTKGRDRAFSMAQGLGRLYYCGFEVVSLREEDNFVWFTVKKVKEPLDTIPSYAFFFKQKRVGKNGKFIFIYKVRTMHPFSEFIHKYIYDRNKLDDKGKIKDDFRISSWGKVFRKLWIDELPMIINWIKRDLKFVGVRPLSETFFNTYPEDLKKLRIENKPGLVPPYYADMPGSIEEVWESERRYLVEYKKKPFRTDWKYFWKAFRNIVFRGAKSS